LLPFTVSVNDGPPKITADGDNDVATGMGLTDGSTVIVGLAETREPFTNRRNSTEAAVDGIHAVQVVSVTPAPTFVDA